MKRQNKLLKIFNKLETLSTILSIINLMVLNSTIHTGGLDFTQVIIENNIILVGDVS